MSVIADAFQPFVRGEFMAIGGRPDTANLTDIITAPKASYYLDFELADLSVSLDFRDPGIVFAALAGDCCRFSAASFQTIGSIADEVLDRDGFAWGMSKLYYAAFYSGHAITRLLGESCSFLDRAHVNKILRTGKAIGKSPDFHFEGGLYKCIITPGTAELKCIKASRGSIGNGHELFWEYLGNKIKEIGEETLKGSLVSADAQAIFAQLEDFRNILQQSGKNKWLSEIRNDIQYRHKYDTWFPAKPTAKQRQIISSLIKNWTHDPMNINLREARIEVLGQFVAGCVFVVAVCRVLLERISERSSVGNKSFVSLGPLAFIKDRQYGSRK